MTREQIDSHYQTLASELEAEFFTIIDEGLPSQHRELKDGLYLTDFNILHGDIWLRHEHALIDAGYLDPPQEPEPPDADTLRAQELLTNPPSAITQPEMWELMRIFGRMHELEFE